MLITLNLVDGSKVEIDRKDISAVQSNGVSTFIETTDGKVYEVDKIFSQVSRLVFNIED